MSNEQAPPNRLVIDVDDLDARGLEAASHMFGIGPSIVIAEHRVPAERRRYLADERTCPGGEDANAPLQEQAHQ